MLHIVDECLFFSPHPLCYSTQCISKLLQELPSHGLLTVSACGTSGLPACACTAKREVLHPPVCVSAPQSPRPPLHLHPLQPPGALAPPQDHHSPVALQLSLQSLGANNTPRSQAGFCPGTHLLLLLLHAWLQSETWLLLSEAAEHREPAGFLQPTLWGDVWRSWRGDRAACTGAAPTSALLLPPQQAEELFHPQYD